MKPVSLTPTSPPMLPRGQLLNTAEPPVIRFELKEELGPGGETVAKMLRWDPATEDYVEGHYVTVVDYLGVFVGQSGDRGYARWWPDRKAYEIFLMECP